MVISSRKDTHGPKHMAFHQVSVLRNGQSCSQEMRGNRIETILDELGDIPRIMQFKEKRLQPRHRAAVYGSS